MIEGYLTGPIGATVSGDNDLVGPPRLGGQRFKGRCDQSLLVVGGNDDDDPARAGVDCVADIASDEVVTACLADGSPFPAGSWSGVTVTTEMTGCSCPVPTSPSTSGRREVHLPGPMESYIAHERAEWPTLATITEPEILAVEGGSCLRRPTESRLMARQKPNKTPNPAIHAGARHGPVTPRPSRCHQRMECRCATTEIAPAFLERDLARAASTPTGTRRQ